MKFINPTKEKWNNFLVNQNGSFLQSWEWLNFQESTGKKVFRFMVEDAGEIIFLAGIIKHNLPFKKSYFYLPYGPVSDLWTSRIHRLENAFNLFFIEITKLAKIENTIFLKLESHNNPTLSFGNTQDKYSAGESKPLKSNNIRIKNNFTSKKSDSLQPKQTLILDLIKSDQDLLSEMKQKTRYNIRLAEKKGVEAEFKENPTKEDFEIFWKLAEETAQRDKFYLHPKDYYKKMVLDSGLKTELAFARFQDNILSANLIIYFGDTAAYLHGASSNEHRELMAPHLLQWQSILHAKNLGYKKYDFWGISEKKWPGVTRFKKGFGGYEISYPGAYDIVFDRFWYGIYKIAKFFRKII